MIRAGDPAATTRIKCENTIIARYPFLADPYGKSRSVSYNYYFNNFVLVFYVYGWLETQNENLFTFIFILFLELMEIKIN